MLNEFMLAAKDAAAPAGSPDDTKDANDCLPDCSPLVKLSTDAVSVSFEVRFDALSNVPVREAPAPVKAPPVARLATELVDAVSVLILFNAALDAFLVTSVRFFKVSVTPLVVTLAEFTNDAIELCPPGKLDTPLASVDALGMLAAAVLTAALMSLPETAASAAA